MKKIGMIGGLGPESTRDYYREILDAFKEAYLINGFPEIVIESCALNQFIQYAGDDNWEMIARIMSDKCENLHHCGADFAFIASNTPHMVFKQVSAISPIPMISIVEATRREAERRGAKKLCLLGTPFTMKERFYADELESAGIAIVTPAAEDQAFIGKTLFEEIELGIINQSTKEEYLRIIDRVHASEEIDGIIMGCTELPMILKPEDIKVEYYDTLKIHVNEIVEMTKADS